MPSTSPLKLLGGLISAPGAGGMDDLSDCINVVKAQGRLECRKGMTFEFDHAGSSAPGFYTEFGGATAPSAPTNGLTDIGTSTDQYLYFGLDTTFNRFQIVGGATDQGTIAQMWQSMRFHKDLVFQYWNGSAWVDLDVATLFKPYRTTATGPSESVYQIAPFCHLTTAGAVTDSDVMDVQMYGHFVTPTDWAQKTFSAITKYWLRVVCSINTTAWTTQVDASLYRTFAPQPVLDLIAFRDRANTRHRLSVYYASSSSLRYVADGVELTRSDPLDAASALFDKRANVTMHYHRTTDRVVGCVDGFGWFYWVPGEASVNQLQAVTSTGSDYDTTPGGLKTVIPTGPVTAIYDDRLFVCKDNVVYYSAPGPFADVWPNSPGPGLWEIQLGDTGGAITGMAVVNGVLVAFKRNSIWILQSSGTEHEYQAYQVPGNVGCIAPKSIAVSGGFVFFAAEDGIYRFDGQSAVKLSTKIDTFYLENIARHDASAMRAVYSTWEDQYRLFYCTPGESLACDAAMYVDNPGGEPTFWPQGRYEDSDYGFHCTAVTADQSTDKEEILLGDEYGVVWKMDSGFTDGPTNVKCSLTTNRLNLGTSGKALVKWVTPTVGSQFKGTMYADVIPEDRAGMAQTVSFDTGGDNAAAAFFITGDTVATADTFSDSYDEQALASGSSSVLGRHVKVKLYKTFEGPLSVTALELEYEPWGRRL